MSYTNNFNIYPNVNTTLYNGDNDLPGGKYANIDESTCQQNCLGNTECYGYVYDNTNNSCFLKTISVLNASRVGQNNVTLGVLASTDIQPYSIKPSQDFANNNIDRDNSVKLPSAELCQSSCSEDINCYAYVYYTDGNCFRKNNNVYVNTSTSYQYSELTSNVNGLSVIPITTNENVVNSGEIQCEQQCTNDNTCTSYIYDNTPTNPITDSTDLTNYSPITTCYLKNETGTTTYTMLQCGGSCIVGSRNDSTVYNGDVNEFGVKPPVVSAVSTYSTNAGINPGSTTSLNRGAYDQTGVSKETDCQELCNENSDCNGYVYFTNKKCALQNNKVYKLNSLGSPDQTVVNFGIKNDSTVPLKHNTGLNQAIIDKYTINTNISANNLKTEIGQNSTLTALQNDTKIYDASYNYYLNKYNALNTNYANKIAQNSALLSSNVALTTRVNELNNIYEADVNIFGKLNTRNDAASSYFHSTVLPNYNSILDHSISLTADNVLIDAANTVLTMDSANYSNALAKLNTDVDGSKQQIYDTEQAIYDANVYAQDILKLLKITKHNDNSVESSLLTKLYNGIVSQNSVIKDTIIKLTQVDTHGQKVYYQTEQTNQLLKIKTYLMYIYYFFVVIVAFIIYNKKWDAYLKFAFLLLFAAFPFYIGMIEDTLMAIGTTIYNKLNVVAYTPNNY